MSVFEACEMAVVDRKARQNELTLVKGKNLAAVELFKQEEGHWPESKVFMDRMIKVASAPVAGTATPRAAP
jgi:hypothetical protein